jgi:succinate-semialdehyde dehydrogenase/glutarate-semialdehyde dehydrogenase
VYDAFVDKVVKQVQALRQGDSGEFDVGAVFWDSQLDIIESHVQDARDKGATVRAGGRRNPNLKGLFYEPTVLTEVDHGMDVMTVETFGPIVAIKKVRDEDEAIRLANESEYGLNGTVWTTDIEKGIELAGRIHTGGVCVNDMTFTYGVPEAPFGGRKASGIGQVNGPEGLRGYCHAQPIAADKKGRGKIQGGYPYSRKDEDGMQKFIRLLWGTRLGRWLS